VPFEAAAPDSDRFVTPDDLAWVRATLDLAPGWVTVLGTAMAPATPAFPWRGVDKATAFARDGLTPIFGDDAGRRQVAGISLGNEPDLTYGNDLARYLGEFPAYANADGISDWPRPPTTSTRWRGPARRTRPTAAPRSSGCWPRSAWTT
jgi:hypothetical protein